MRKVDDELTEATHGVEDGIEPRPRWWKVSALTIAPTLLRFSFYCDDLSNIKENWVSDQFKLEIVLFVLEIRNSRGKDRLFLRQGNPVFDFLVGLYEGNIQGVRKQPKYFS